jgi:hypothetical protein
LLSLMLFTAKQLIRSLCWTTSSQKMWEPAAKCERREEEMLVLWVLVHESWWWFVFYNTRTCYSYSNDCGTCDYANKIIVCDSQSDEWTIHISQCLFIEQETCLFRFPHDFLTSAHVTSARWLLPVTWSPMPSCLKWLNRVVFCPGNFSFLLLPIWCWPRNPE